MDTRIQKDFADGFYSFWLPMPRIVAVEREIGRLGEDGIQSPGSILGAFSNLGNNLGQGVDDLVLLGPTSFRVSDAHSIIRNALVGGGEGTVSGETLMVTDTVARSLVDAYCYPARPAMHDVALAWDILKAAVLGVANDAKKKPTRSKKQSRSVRV